MSTTIVTPPAIEPIGLQQAKDHVRSDTTDDDAELSSWIIEAREFAENFTNRALITQTVDVRLDRFPGSHEDDFAILQGGVGAILMPKPQLQSVTSINYINTAGVSTLLDAADYDVDIYSAPARVRPAFGLVWPQTRDVDNAVTIRAVVGYGDGPATIPAPIISAMLLIIGTRFDHRADHVVGTITSPMPVPAQATSLLMPFRVFNPRFGI